MGPGPTGPHADRRAGTAQPLVIPNRGAGSDGQWTGAEHVPEFVEARDDGIGAGVP